MQRMIGKGRKRIFIVFGYTLSLSIVGIEINFQGSFCLADVN